MDSNTISVRHRTKAVPCNTAHHVLKFLGMRWRYFDEKPAVGFREQSNGRINEAGVAHLCEIKLCTQLSSKSHFRNSDCESTFAQIMAGNDQSAIYGSVQFAIGLHRYGGIHFGNMPTRFLQNHRGMGTAEFLAGGSDQVNRVS